MIMIITMIKYQKEISYTRRVTITEKWYLNN